MSDQEFELDIRQKEVVMEFRRWLKQNQIEIFTSDIFRSFLKEKDWTNRVLDNRDKPTVNVGGYFTSMLKAKNPLHRIVKVRGKEGYTASKVDSNKKREIRKFRLYQQTS